MTATVAEAQANFSELVRRAKTGEEVIITSGCDETPEVRLVPVLRQRKRRLGVLSHLNIKIPDEFFAPLNDEELKEWYGEDVQK